MAKKKRINRVQQIQRYIASGGKSYRPRKKNPRAAGNPASVEQAAQLFREFRESEPGKVTAVPLRMPTAAMVVGDIDGIAYRTDHGGKLVKYLHEFKPGARPQLLASADGKVLIIYGGKFRFTADGIVDGR